MEAKTKTKIKTEAKMKTKMQAKIYNQKGMEAGEIDLPSKVFAARAGLDLASLAIKKRGKAISPASLLGVAPRRG